MDVLVPIAYFALEKKKEEKKKDNFFKYSKT